MRTVQLAGWPEPVSALGFGCASLGSRISRKVGIAAIERALAAGVTWFDVAPSYGDGEAERILGEALAGAKVAIVTKVGLRARPASALTKALRNVARPIVAAAPRLRSAIKAMRGEAIERIALDAESIRAGVMRSLERLRVDRLAVLALHDPSVDDLRREEVLRALDDVKRQGLAACVGVAGSLGACLAASNNIDVAQFAVSPSAGSSNHVAYLRTRGTFTVMHSVLAARDSITAAPMNDRATEKSSQAALRYSFGANAAGVVLASSFAPEHLRANVAAASEQPDTAFALSIEHALRGQSGGR